MPKSNIITLKVANVMRLKCYENKKWRSKSVIRTKCFWAKSVIVISCHVIEFVGARKMEEKGMPEQQTVIGIFMRECR